MKISLPAVALALLMLAGCGSSDSGVEKSAPKGKEESSSTEPKPSPALDPATPTVRPTVDELRRAIELTGGSVGFTGEVALCGAKLFVNSDISDETLRHAVESADSQNSPPIPPRDQKILDSKKFQRQYKKCTDLMDQDSGVLEIPSKPSN